MHSLKINKYIISFLVTIVFLCAAKNIQAVVIDTGPQISTFTNLTRGYWFVAPTNFYIVGLGVSTDASSENFDVQLLRLNAPPPSFPSTTTDFTTLFTAKNVPGSSLVPVNISVATNDIIGVLGSRGASATNSYGANPFNSSILGNPVVLSRLGMQAQLRTTNASDVGVFTESATGIGRVFVDVEQVAVPEPSTIVLFALTSLCFALRRKAA